MNMETRVLLQPLLDLWVLVGGIIVTDQMKGFVLGRFPVNLTQKRQPFAVPMMWLTLGNDLASRTFNAANSVVVPWRL